MSDGKMREAVISLIVLNMLENEKDEIVYSKHLTRKWVWLETREIGSCKKMQNSQNENQRHMGSEKKGKSKILKY